VYELWTDRLLSTVLLRARGEAEMFATTEGQRRQAAVKKACEQIVSGAQYDIRDCVRKALDDGTSWTEIEEHMVKCLREAMTKTSKRLRSPSPKRQNTGPIGGPIGGAPSPSKVMRNGGA